MPHVDVVTSKVRAFLLQHPKPHFLRLANEDGVQEELKVGKQPFVRLAETIVALDPMTVECLDKDKNLVRAFRMGEADVRRSEAAEVPQILSDDPQAALLTHFSNLLHRAYEHSTEIAFGKLVELVDRIDARSDAIEQRLERTESQHRKALQQQLEDQWDRLAEEEERAKENTPAGGLVNHFLQGAMAGNNMRKTNGKAE